MTTDAELLDLADHVCRAVRPRYRRIPWDDLYAIALDAAWEATEKHDPERGPLLHYACRLCAWGIARAGQREARHWRVMHPEGWGEDGDRNALEEIEQPERVPAVDLADRDDFWRRVREALTPRQYEVVELNCRRGLNLQEVAERMGFSHQRARDAKTTAMRKLRPVLEEFAA